MLEPIRLEPKLIYDRAITHVSDKNVATYSYWLLVECAAEQCEVDVPDAMDWVDFNIVGLQAGSDDRFKIDYGVRDEHE
jgi:hypothetical protein